MSLLVFKIRSSKWLATVYFTGACPPAYKLGQFLRGDPDVGRTRGLLPELPAREEQESQAGSVMAECPPRHTGAELQHRR